MRSRLRLWTWLAVLVLILAPAAEALAAAAPEIYSIIEGRDTRTGQPVLVLMGKKLTKIKGYDILPVDSLELYEEPEMLMRGKSMVVLGLQEDLPQGAYTLRLFYGKGDQLDLEVSLATREALPGTIDIESLQTDLRDDLDDARTLEGKDAAYFRNASNLNSGTVSPDRFSAIADLLAENRVGDGANQVAAGDHDHDERYTKPADLSTPGAVNDESNPVDWSKLKNVPAGIGDGEDMDTTYTAGEGLELDGTEFKVGTVDWSKLGNRPDGLDDGDDDTTYTAGEGLTLTGSVFGLGAVAWAKLTGVPDGFQDGKDDDTKYTAGSGLSLTNGEFSVDQVDFTGLSNVPDGLSDGDNDTTYTAGEGLLLDSGEFSVSEGQVKIWAHELYDVVKFTAGTGISISGDTISVTDTVDDDTTYTAGTGLQLSGTRFSVKTAFSPSASASGTNSAAFGSSTVASGYDSFAAGQGSKATGIRSMALGSFTTASGSASTAIGGSTTASGYASTAMGSSTTASGDGALATGYKSEASGDQSMTANRQTKATGFAASAFGWETEAQSQSSFTIGRYNTIAGDKRSWVSTDPLLVAGNGTDDESRADALTLLKNGDLTIAGKFTATGKIDWSNLTNVPDDEPTYWTQSSGDVYRNSKVGVNMSAAPATAELQVTSTNGVLFTGTRGSGSIPATGAGTRFMWYPRRAALRAGYVTDSRWDDDKIGDDSIALGRDSAAKASGSTAIGRNTIADGVNSLAMGTSTWASGNTASAFGMGTTASGDRSTSLGGNTESQAYSSLVIGRYNELAGSKTSWAATDPLFVAGNGSDDDSRANAFEILKNGDTTINGTDTGLTVSTSASGSNTLVVNYEGGAGSSSGSGSSGGAQDNIAVFQKDGNVKARVNMDGKFFGQQFKTSGADFAESVAVKGGKKAFEAGDVIVIDVDTDRQFALSSEAESTLVAGVYATKPGILAMPRDAAGDDQSWVEKEIPMAVVGIVPTKVCDEGGAIRRGDLLVSSSIPGYAKKAPRNVRPGTIIGKALGKLDKGTGKIEILLSLQ